MKLNKNGILYHKDENDNLYFKYNVDEDISYELHVSYKRFRQITKGKGLENFEVPDFFDFPEYENYVDGELFNWDEELSQNKERES